MRPDSQCARVLRVLADGRTHSVPEIHRRAGTMRLNSRIAELRKQGFAIECERRPGVKGAGGYAYRLTGWTDQTLDQVRATGILDEAADTTHEVDGDTFAPRNDEERYRIYRLRHDLEEPELVATCGSHEAVGVALMTLGAEGEFDRASVGVLDALAGGGGDPKWKLNPWEPYHR